MPVNNPGGSGAGGSGAGGGSGQQQQGGQRATFRPPWVKQGPQPIPMPTAPWAPNRVRTRGNTAYVVFVSESWRVAVLMLQRTSNAEAEPAPAPVRKQSKITIIPSHPTNQTQPQQQAAAPRENGQNVSTRVSLPLAVRRYASLVTLPADTRLLPGLAGLQTLIAAAGGADTPSAA